MESNTRRAGVTVFLCKGDKRIECTCEGTDALSAEDLCLKIAKSMNLRPISFHLFALRVRDLKTSSGATAIWLPPCYKFNPTQSYHVDFRLRIKLPSLTSLCRLDEAAFDYLFYQMRYDLLNCLIPEICTDETKAEALGLCITDMLRVIQENVESREQVENNYRQFISKPLYKQHSFFLKRRIHDTLSRLLLVQDKSCNAKYIKEQYVGQIEELAPSYLTEEFHTVTFKEEEYPATIRVDPFHPNQRGISLANIGKNNWEHLCTIEDLCFISMRGDNMVEISRKNGIPISCKFKTMELVQSFISLLDGHYRLTEKWTFNLCKDLFTPSLVRLKMIKCHGPVGEKFSHQKLRIHASSKKGTFILRQSSTSLSEFSIDFILEAKNRAQTKEVRCSQEGRFFLEIFPEISFSTVADFISHFIMAEYPDFPIKECLPPSEYDLSPLLVCRSQRFLTDVGLGKCVVGKENPLHGSLTLSAPQVISAQALQVFRGRTYEYNGNTCKVVKAVWKQSKTTVFNVAIKFLKKENEERLMKEFLEIADQCVLWQCESLVNLRGVVLGNPHALVLDWMPLGPLDLYLQENSLLVESVELIEAASHIAKALWFLEDHGIVHGNIRCHNVMVAEHNDSGLIVKLADPSIVEQNLSAIHWIPPELLEKPGLVKKFVSADVWAVGTTLWEVFSFGAKPPQDQSATVYKIKYQSGWRLPRPDKCPLEIQRIINECWSYNPITRKQPQALVRDIHQILYQLIESKRAHTYETVSISSSEGGHSRDNNGFDISTDNFNWTTFGSDMNAPNIQDFSDGTVSTFIHDSDSNASGRTQCTWLFQEVNGSSPSPDLISGFSELYMNGSIGSIYSLARGIYSTVFGKNQITVGRLIGQGCYGAVYMGELERSSDGFIEPVAVKMMKSIDNIPEKENLDFQREFNILHKLCHTNIVEVKGVVNDPNLLIIMEYLPMGSLLEHFRMCPTKPGTRQLLKFAQDVADGMEYLSTHNIVHRDLAARNLLVANEDLIKISDFGLARFTGNDNCYTLLTDRKLPIKWYPPESLQFGKFSELSDVWSYGVTMYEMFSYGEDPNLPGMTGTDDELEKMMECLNKGIRLPCPETCPQIVYTHLMLPCWQLNSQKRPTFRKLVGDVREVETQLI